MIALVHRRLILALFILSAAMVISSIAQAANGGELYQRCSTCHQPDGAGIPGIFPALKNRLADIMASVEGREYVTMVLINGLIGTIDIDGQRYVGAMPAQHLTDVQIAEVIDYVVNDLGTSVVADSSLPVSSDEVAGIRLKYAESNAHPTLDLRSKVPALTVQ